MRQSAQITTQAELARALDVIQSVVSRMVRRPDWKWGKGPWKRSLIPEMQRWRAANLKQGRPEKPRDGAADQKMFDLRFVERQAKVREINAKAEAAETSLAREKGKLIPVADVVAEWTRIGQRIRNELQNLASSIVPDALTLGMPMQAAAEFQTKCEAKILGVLRVMSDAGRNETDEEAA